MQIDENIRYSQEKQIVIKSSNEKVSHFIQINAFIHITWVVSQRLAKKFHKAYVISIKRLDNYQKIS